MPRLLRVALVLLTLTAAATASRGGTEGYLYGTVETEDGQQYTGLLRWGGEEAFWDDLFNGGKVDRPWLDAVPASELRRQRGIRLFGIRLTGHGDGFGDDRQVVARFGDLREIRIAGHRPELVMKNGSVVRFDDTSNDVGAEITIWDAGLDRVEVPWKRIERVTFQQAPAEIAVPGYRLQGRVMTEQGEFEGFIQWDSDECLSIDELDGDTRDGDVSIRFENIRVIEKRDRHGAWVELTDGRRLLLEDTNDVDHSTNGIFVEDPRFGRVLISWEAFERAELRVSPRSGRAYSDYAPASRELRGRVVAVDGRTLSGAIALDLDEAEGWELLNGEVDGIEYYIPMARVATIEPVSGRASEVTLRDGRRLRLEESVDVSDRGDGVAVRTDARRPAYLPWREVRRIEFEASPSGSEQPRSE